MSKRFESIGVALKAILVLALLVIARSVNGADLTLLESALSRCEQLKEIQFHEIAYHKKQVPGLTPAEFYEHQRWSRLPDGAKIEVDSGWKAQVLSKPRAARSDEQIRSRFGLATEPNFWIYVWNPEYAANIKPTQDRYELTQLDTSQAYLGNYSWLVDQIVPPLENWINKGWINSVQRDPEDKESVFASFQLPDRYSDGSYTCRFKFAISTGNPVGYRLTGLDRQGKIVSETTLAYEYDETLPRSFVPVKVVERFESEENTYDRTMELRLVDLAPDLGVDSNRLRYYGLPEPEFTRRRPYFSIGMIAIGVGFLLAHLLWKRPSKA